MRNGLRLTLAVAAVWGAISVSAADVAAAPFDGVVIKGKPYVYDPDNALDVMRICAGCHGDLGAGGGGGSYPRLGGLNADDLVEQFKKFKTRERENIPMIPFAVDREMSEADVLDVSRRGGGQPPVAGRAREAVLALPRPEGNRAACGAREGCAGDV